MNSRLPTAAPFHLEATVRVLQRRPSSHEVWDAGRYLRVFTTQEGPVLTAVENRGSLDAPDVRLSFLTGAPSAGTQRSIEQIVGKMLGLSVDPAPLHAAGVRLRSLRPTALALRGMRPPRFATLFDTFGNVVPYQQRIAGARPVRPFGTSTHIGMRSPGSTWIDAVRRV
jgi:DNA-3-methyladenine glycosylase II